MQNLLSELSQESLHDTDPITGDRAGGRGMEAVGDAEEFAVEMVKAPPLIIGLS